MKVLQETATKLVLKLGVPLLNHGTCTIDRAAGQVTVAARMFIWPRKRTVPLADVQGVELYRSEVTPPDPARVSYCPALRLMSGRRLFLPGFGRKSSAAAVERIRAFLA